MKLCIAGPALRRAGALSGEPIVSALELQSLGILVSIVPLSLKPSLQIRCVPNDHSWIGKCRLVRIAAKVTSIQPL